MLRLPALLFTLIHIAHAIRLNVTGNPAVGNALSLSWDGVSPWSLTILTATSANTAFTLYQTFSQLTVLNAVWNVDVAAGSLVEFQITDASGDSTSQLITIAGPAAALSSSAIASSQSIASTQSMASMLSASSVASTSSLFVTTSAAVSGTTAPALTSSPTSSTTLQLSSTAYATATSASASHSISVSAAASHTSPGSSSSSSVSPAGTVLPNTAAHSTGPNPGAIAGGVIGGILGALLLAVIFWQCFIRRRQMRAYDTEPHPYLETGGDGEKYAFGAANLGSSTAHRRTLTRSQVFHPPHTVDWNPEEPRLAPNVAPVNGNDLFSIQTRENDAQQLRPGSTGLGRFAEVLGNGTSNQQDHRWPNTNALNVDLAPPPPAMTTVAGRPSVLDLARGAAPKTDLPLYNPTSIQQPGFGWNGRSSLDEQQDSPGSRRSATGRGGSPFADKFAVQGKYVPDLQDPAVAALHATATGGQASLSPAPRPPRPARPAAGLHTSANSTTAMDLGAETWRHSFSNPGPEPTVGHSRKISGPIPLVFSQPPSTGGGAAAASGGPANSNVPSWALPNEDSRYPAITVQTPTTASTMSGLAGIGAAGRLARENSLAKNAGKPIYPVAAMAPSRVRPPKPVPVTQQQRQQQRSPPPSRSRGMKPASSATSPPPMLSLPLSPPRKLAADPDVPTTPNTPNLGSFPAPPRTLAMTAGSSAASSFAGLLMHNRNHSKQSSFGSLPSSDRSVTAPTTATGEDLPQESPMPKGRSLHPPPPPISVGHAYNKGGLSPITASPVSVAPIPSPLASSALQSPTSPSRYAAKQQQQLTRDNSAATTSTSILCCEILQGVRNGASATGKNGMSQTPVTPGFMPDAAFSNFHRPSPPPPLPTTSLSPVALAPVSAVPRESWDMAPSLYHHYEAGATGKVISLSSKHLSAASGRRLSDITAGDAEWRELERQLNWTAGARDEAHVMPRSEV